jgi:hypothetical protein
VPLETDRGRIIFAPDAPAQFIAALRSGIEFDAQRR